MLLTKPENSSRLAEYELEKIRLWNELPDYFKTHSLLENIKTLCSDELLRQLKSTDKATPLGGGR